MGIAGSQQNLPDETFLWELPDEEHEYRKYIKSPVFSLQKEYFVAFINHDLSTIFIYCCSASQWQYDECFTFTITLSCPSFDQQTLTTSAVFSHNSPFCSIISRNLYGNISIGITLCKNYPYTRKDHFLGILNSGSTCYMASILQVLFHTGSFRRLVFDYKDTKDAISALQRLFIELQLSSRAPTLDSFIRSLGSFHDLAMVQNDAHEFFIAFFERLETDLGESFTKRINDIFGAVTTTTIDCPSYSFSKTTDEQFYSFPIVVEGLRNLEESLNLVTAKEKIEDYVISEGYEMDNESSTQETQNSENLEVSKENNLNEKKYKENEFDNNFENTETKENEKPKEKKKIKADAQQSMVFKRLPPILSFHLCRFSYNSKTNSVVELRNAFDCPFELDMAKYAPGVEGETKYELYSITAHSGNPIFGHYTSYIRPQLGEQWILFNDGNTKIVEEQVIRRLFGTENASQPSFFKAFTFTSALAYMLFYVRKDSFHYVATNDSIPLHLVPHRSNLFFSQFIFSEDIIGQPIEPSTPPFEWEDHNLTAKNILSKLYPNRPLDGYRIWAQLPGKSQFIGPMDIAMKPAEFVVKGHSTNFYVLPSKVVDCPVFLLSDSTPRICLACSELNHIPSFPGKTIEHQHRPIEHSGTVHQGSRIFAHSKKNITLKFDVHRFSFVSDSTYADVQKRLAIFYDIQPWRILVLHKMQPMIPHQYPYVNTFPRTDLTYQALKDPVTACSIKLFTPVTMICVAPTCTQQHLQPVWVRKGTTSAELISMLPKFFTPKTSERTKILCSIGKLEAIESVLKAGDSPRKQCVRYDVIRYEVPFLRSRLKTMLKKGLSMGIEVRFASSMKSFSFEGTSRIISITKTMTLRDVWQKMMNICGSSMEQPKQAFVFISEKSKIRIEILPDEVVFECLLKFVNKMTKEVQRLCIALVSDNPMIVSNAKPSITRSLSGIINKKKRDSMDIKQVSQEA
ncbi:Clan CA, family C19, ubiquitin hydrolase-like cysteine peptidase [Tritrichomonas foetus]|uniref:Ubiquitin carboxyl-terminal hydrolase n=1 Tax=Tritrichomonas foetus TaxID=1144522 RepID=A0A1J4KE77_9EUKA|nr:Clan CA, family C19, ubiquitin hydrolase-like cysteine peptidase [Tritrichomonas foetus]|eukprot:OHT07934.1 Clan CA, family C19, ubiquitin hydrolase-like cysteine peptidase [Tritrichomonas foetus]